MEKYKVESEESLMEEISQLCYANTFKNQHIFKQLTLLLEEIAHSFNKNSYFFFSLITL